MKKEKRSKSRKKKCLGVICVICGILLIASAVLLLDYNNKEDLKAKEASDKVLAQMEIGQEKSPEFMPPEHNEEMTVKNIDGLDYIGYLSIPALDRVLPILADWDFDNLPIAPIRYYGSTKTDNLVLGAHNYRFHFGPISRLEPDDDIYFTDIEGIKTSYKVTNVEILRPTDIQKMIHSEADLTLFTCNYGGSRRITVRCEKVN